MKPPEKYMKMISCI